MVGYIQVSHYFHSFIFTPRIFIIFETLLECCPDLKNIPIQELENMGNYACVLCRNESENSDEETFHHIAKKTKLNFDNNKEKEVEMI